MKQYHTPGEWQYDTYLDSKTGHTSYACDGSVRKDYDFRVEWNEEMSDKEKVANSALISAAPNMLALIKKLAEIEGSVTIHKGMAWTEAGESIDLNELLKMAVHPNIEEVED